MTIHQALHQGQQQLTNRSDSPRLDAEMLLAHVLKTDRADLLRRDQDTLSDEARHQLNALVSSRASGYPIAYLTNWKDFYGLRLRVAPEVLIPRPATELLIDHVRERVPSDEHVVMADIGTGSGAIAIALATHFPRATILATDISPVALSIAHYNAHHHHLTSRIRFAYGSLLTPLAKLPSPDVIVANLPYLTPEEMRETTIQSEPRLALAGGHDGLHILRAFCDQLPTVSPWRGLVLELSPHHVDKVMDFFTAHWPQYRAETLSDGRAIRGIALWE